MSKDDAEKHQIKSLEFKLYLSDAQIQQLDQWREAQRRVWNKALELLKEYEAFTAFNKVPKPPEKQTGKTTKYDWLPSLCCPMPWEYRWQKEEDGTFTAIPYSPIANPNPRSPSWMSCPMPRSPESSENLPYEIPRLSRDSEYSITPLMAYNLPENQWLKDSGCPYKFTQGTVKAIATAWQEYRKHRLESPKFKGYKFPIKTLSDVQSGNATIHGDYVKIPKLGLVKIKSAKHRLYDGIDIRSYRIMKEPSGYYFLAVIRVDKPSKAPKKPTEAVGVDPGVVYAVTCSDGTTFKNQRHTRKTEQKLKQLQQQMARREKGSANWLKTKAAIAKLHEGNRRSRKAYNHKISSRLVETYGAIAIEKNRFANMVRAPKAKPNEEGTGYLPNGAKAKAGLNKSLLDVGGYQLRQLIEEKAKASGVMVELVEAHHNSQRCSSCGHVAPENRQSQALFKCVACGHTENADVNAAKNVLARMGGCSE